MVNQTHVPSAAGMPPAQQQRLLIVRHQASPGAPAHSFVVGFESPRWADIVATRMDHRRSPKLGHHSDCRVTTPTIIIPLIDDTRRMRGKNRMTRPALRGGEIHVYDVMSLPIYYNLGVVIVRGAEPFGSMHADKAIFQVDILAPLHDVNAVRLTLERMARRARP